MCLILKIPLADGKQSFGSPAEAGGASARADAGQYPPSQLQSAYLGLQVQRIQRGRDDVSVVVRYPGRAPALPLLQDFLVAAPGDSASLWARS